MHALDIYAGPTALQHLRAHGLQAQHVGAIAAAAGGPKGLMLMRLDRFIFGKWLPAGGHKVDLLGGSIGAWRMACACLPDPVQALAQLEHSYIHDELPTRSVRGKLRPPLPEQVSAGFARNLRMFYEGQLEALLAHPRWRLHIFTARGKHILAREQRVRTALGYAGAYAANAVHRRCLGAFLQRVVFSSPDAQCAHAPAALPFDAGDYPTRHLLLRPQNFMAALQASGSIPFVLQAVEDIEGAPRGAYWDGGITDYHLHLRYFAGRAALVPGATQGALVLYPHFQRVLVAGWLDKHLPWRWRNTHALDRMVLLAPNPQWLAQCVPGGKLPDRNDFMRYLGDHAARVRLWQGAVDASAQLAHEWEQWLDKPDLGRVQALV